MGIVIMIWICIKSLRLEQNGRYFANDFWYLDKTSPTKGISMVSFDKRSGLVQEVAWCRQTPSHFLNRWWPSGYLTNGVAKQSWVGGKLGTKLIRCLISISKRRLRKKRLICYCIMVSILICYSRQWTGSALVNAVDYCLFSNKPLLQSMLTYYHLDLNKAQTSMKFESKYEIFHWIKCIWKWHCGQGIFNPFEHVYITDRWQRNFSKYH